MKVKELIELLEDAPEDIEVRIARDNMAIEHRISGAGQAANNDEDEDDAPECFYIGMGSNIGYLSGPVLDVVGLR